MAEGSLIISGNKYISSARAAELFGYTKDYVGQLCRAGKLDAQLIGRSWYVSEDSLRKHKLSVHYTLKSPKKTRKEKADINEIVSIHKDSSGIRETEAIKRTPPQHADVVPEQEDIGAALLPSLHKTSHSAAHDELVRTEFRYETEQPLVYDEEYKPCTSNVDSEERAIKRVIIRVPPREHTPRFERITAGVVPPSSEISGTARATRTAPTTSVSMDGIVASPQPLVRYTAGYQNNDDVHRRPKALEEEYQTDMRSGAPQRERRSLAVPVLGALIVFAAFVLAYLLLT